MTEVEQLRALIATSPLPRADMLTARDVADSMHLTLPTIYTWTSRGLIHRTSGRYDWREVALCKMTRDTTKVRHAENRRLDRAQNAV